MGASFFSNLDERQELAPMGRSYHWYPGLRNARP